MSDNSLPTTSPSFSTEAGIPIHASLPSSSASSSASTAAAAASPSADPFPFPPPVVRTLVKSTNPAGHKLVNEYELLTPLGEGAYATVTLAQHVTTGQLVALKKMSKSKLGRVKEYTVGGGGGGGGGGRPMLGRPRMMTALDKVRKEIAIMQRLRSDYLVRLLALIDDDGQDALYLVLEAADRGQIMDWDGDALQYRSRVLPTSPHGGIQEAAIRHVLLDLLSGLDYLHSHRIVHRDVKPDNLLLFSSPHSASGYATKLADFGVARELADGETLTETQGTFHFYAPEMCTGERYEARGQDVWAVGVTLFILCTGRVPWMSKDNNPAELFELIANAPVVFPDACEVSAELKDLILSILEKEPKKRITLRDIRGHSWLVSSPAGSTAGSTTSSTKASAASAVVTAAVMATKKEEEQKVSQTNAK